MFLPGETLPLSPPSSLLPLPLLPSHTLTHTQRCDHHVVVDVHQNVPSAGAAQDQTEEAPGESPAQGTGTACMFDQYSNCAAVIMVCECDGICNDRVCSMECAVMMEFAVMVEFNNGLCCRSSGGGGVKSNSLRGSLSTSRHKVCLPLLPFHSLTALVCLFPLFSTPPSFFHLSL